MQDSSFSSPIYPFYQGQLDFFCAIYAVLNAMQISYDINPRDALSLFKDAIKHISAEEKYWSATLNNNTDFHWLPLWLLYQCSTKYPVRVKRPFGLVDEDSFWELHKAQKIQFKSFIAKTLKNKTTNEASFHFTNFPLYLPDNHQTKEHSSQTVAQSIENWLTGGMCRAVILRFHRHLPFATKPIVSHWTVGYYMVGSELRLLDASKEKNSMHNINLQSICTHVKNISKDTLIRIEPESLYFVEPL